MKHKTAEISLAKALVALALISFTVIIITSIGVNVAEAFGFRPGIDVRLGEFTARMQNVYEGRDTQGCVTCRTEVNLYNDEFVAVFPKGSERIYHRSIELDTGPVGGPVADALTLNSAVSYYMDRPTQCGDSTCACFCGDSSLGPAEQGLTHTMQNCKHSEACTTINAEQNAFEKNKYRKLQCSKMRCRTVELDVSMDCDEKLDWGHSSCEGGFVQDRGLSIKGNNYVPYGEPLWLEKQGTTLMGCKESPCEAQNTEENKQEAPSDETSTA